MAWETRVQSLVKSYQRLKKWYLMPQYYKVGINGKVVQSRERSSALYLGVVATEKRAFRSHLTTVTNLLGKISLQSLTLPCTFICYFSPTIRSTIWKAREIISTHVSWTNIQMKKVILNYNFQIIIRASLSEGGKIYDLSKLSVSKLKCSLCLHRGYFLRSIFHLTNKGVIHYMRYIFEHVEV